MSIYAVVPLKPNQPWLQKAISEQPEGCVYVLPNDAGWLVQSNKTAQELSAELGIPVRRAAKPGDEDVETVALVTAFERYYGLGPKDMWAWVRDREAK